MKRRRFDDVSLEIPADWVDTSVVTLVGQDSKRFAPNLVVTREALAADDVAAYARSMLPELRSAVKMYELVSEREESIGGRDAFVLEHRFLTPERMKVRQLQYFFRRNDEVIVVSLTCAEQEVDARSATLRAIVASLSIEEPM